MTLQQTIDSAVKALWDKWDFLTREATPPILMRFPHDPKKVEEFLISSIKKAVEEAYEDLAEDVGKMVVPFCRLECGAGHELKTNILSLIEKKKSEFLNK